jgi:cytochrome P450
MRYLLPNTLSLMDGAEHRYYRGAMQSLFRPAAMDGYHQLVHQTVSESIEGWQTDRIIKLFPKLKALTLASAAKVFIGIDLERDLHHILRLGAIVDRGFAALVPRPVPGLSLWRALRAREALRAYFRALIPERRRSQSKDLFGVLCRTTDEHGVLLSDDAVIDQLLGLLRASSDSITGSLSVAVHHLARHPQWQERLRERSRSLGPGPLGSEELNSLQEHELFFFEALRLFPVTPQLFRRSVRDCEYRGRKIPSGTQVAVDIGYIHRSPLYWTEPLRFDPLRFAAPRLEHKRQKFQWLPFGSGAHNCIAQFFAIPFAKYVLHLLLTRYRFERTDDGEFVLVLVPATFPKDGLKMRLRPLAR